MKSMQSVKPVQLSLGSKFKFRCYPGIKCFTKCCGKIDIALTPYDIVRIKHRLGIGSIDFLKQYTRQEIDEKSGLPIVFLKMTAEGERLCPFVTEAGCTIYSDRPAACRYYPIGQGTLQTEQGVEEFYFMVKEPYCCGFEENTDWTVESWRVDQEPALYDDMNREWKSMMLRRDADAKKAIDDKQQSMFFLASYDMDNFRRFIFNSRFLEVFSVEPEVLAEMEKDDVALMKFGFRYLKHLLLIEETLKTKEAPAAASQPTG